MRKKGKKRVNNATKETEVGEAQNVAKETVVGEALPLRRSERIKQN